MKAKEDKWARVSLDMVRPPAEQTTHRMQNLLQHNKPRSSTCHLLGCLGKPGRLREPGIGQHQATWARAIRVRAVTRAIRVRVVLVVLLAVVSNLLLAQPTVLAGQVPVWRLGMTTISTVQHLRALLINTGR